MLSGNISRDCQIRSYVCGNGRNQVGSCHQLATRPRAYDLFGLSPVHVPYRGHRQVRAVASYPSGITTTRVTREEALLKKTSGLMTGLSSLGTNSTSMTSYPRLASMKLGFIFLIRPDKGSDSFAH